MRLGPLKNRNVSYTKQHLLTLTEQHLVPVYMIDRQNVQAARGRYRACVSSAAAVATPEAPERGSDAFSGVQAPPFYIDVLIYDQDKSPARRRPSQPLSTTMNEMPLSTNTALAEKIAGLTPGDSSRRSTVLVFSLGSDVLLPTALLAQLRREMNDLLVNFGARKRTEQARNRKWPGRLAARFCRGAVASEADVLLGVPACWAGGRIARKK